MARKTETTGYSLFLRDTVLELARAADALCEAQAVHAVHRHMIPCNGYSGPDRSKESQAVLEEAARNFTKALKAVNYEAKACK